MAETTAAPSAKTATPSRRSPGRRLLFLCLVLVSLEAAGWLGDYIYNHRNRLLAALAMMRLDTQPIPALSATSHDLELVLRDPNDGPGAAEPYRIGGVEIAEAGPWIGTRNVVPTDVIRDNQQRVFVIGGSAAFGFPYRYANSFSGMLDHVFASERLKILNSARVGWTSGELAPLVDQVVRFYQPSAIVLMVGNNEWFHWQPVPPPRPGQPPPDTAAPREELSQTSINLLKTLAHSRVLAAIEYGLVKWMIANRQAQQNAARDSQTRDRFESHHELIGSSYAVEMPLSPDQYDPAQWLTAREKYLATFQTNLKQMVTVAQDAGVPVILLTVPFNPRLSPAWKHRQPHSFDPEHRPAVTEAIRSAADSVSRGDFADGLKTATTALALDPHPAVLYYLKAECLEGLEQHENAERAYAESRERMMGNLGGRLSTNRIIRDLAKENNVPMIDVQELFQQYGTSRQRYYNIDLIHDDCHPTPLGHQLISEVLAPLLRRVVADKPSR